jgi:hypothetical protein
VSQYTRTLFLQGTVCEFQQPANRKERPPPGLNGGLSSLSQFSIEVELGSELFPYGVRSANPMVAEQSY